MEILLVCVQQQTMMWWRLSQESDFCEVNLWVARFSGFVAFWISSSALSGRLGRGQNTLKCKLTCCTTEAMDSSQERPEVDPRG